MELLAPAGTKEAFTAAINAGADAIYLGGKEFSARAYSSNFTQEEIAELIKYAHIRDVRVYVTVNTLLFEDEIEKAYSFCKYLYEHDVDAILIQDLGLAALLHKTIPDLNLHASTQLNCHNIIQAKSLINLGFKRLVLAREVSLTEAKRIKDLGVEVELFVQGALCVSYSGNCLMSSFIGGRSGNRGRCAQPCRRQTTIVHDNIEQGRYSISTKDLLTIEHLKDYYDFQIDSLKIEGRMKREEYIYQVVSSYRKGIDLVLQNKQNNLKDDIENIKKLFNRQFTKGYVLKETRTKVLNQDTPSHLGVLLGEVVDVKNNFIYVKLKEDLNVGDGIKFLNKDLDGLLITRMSVGKDFVKEAKQGQVVSFSRNNLVIEKGTIVHKTTDSKLNKRIQELSKINKLIPLSIVLEISVNKPLRATIIDNRENEIIHYSSFIVQEAITKPTSKDRVIEQIKKVDDNPYYFEKLNVNYNEDCFIPISLLNSFRRELLTLITSKRENINNYDLNKILNYKSNFNLENIKEEILVKVDTEEQCNTILEQTNFNLLIEQDIYSIYKDNDRVFCFNKRVNHLDQERLSNQMTSYYKETLMGFNMMSYYGNVTNSYALDLLFEKGYSLVFASCECSKRQIKLMIDGFKNRHGILPNLGIHIYGYIDYMIMKSCPISSANKLEKDHCLLCKKNRYYLKDHIGVTFPIVTDNACTTRILSSRPISLSSKIDELKDLKIKTFLIDFTIENKSKVFEVMNKIYTKESISKKDFFGHYINEIE